ncbi:hypothetical protein E2C01_092041 [Portunus trituberculatus]|uniref:Secreted protein n=1 Tax=Portunus trituberculatus TaxID=210409 RepID=A0A5B7JQB0_PORTR|nr:hypothetical protein [Portunus trituberculatus]
MVLLLLMVVVVLVVVVQRRLRAEKHCKLDRNITQVHMITTGKEAGGNRLEREGIFSERPHDQPERRVTVIRRDAGNGFIDLLKY